MTVYSAGEMDADGRLMRGFADTGEIDAALAKVPGVIEAAPVVRGQVMISDGERNSGAEVYGIRAEDFAAIPALIAYNKMQGDVAKAQARMEAFADEFSAILSRQIDHHSADRAA